MKNISLEDLLFKQECQCCYDLVEVTCYQEKLDVDVCIWCYMDFDEQNFNFFKKDKPLDK